MFENGRREEMRLPALLERVDGSDCCPGPGFSMPRLLADLRGPGTRRRDAG
jgi:hypothetical protein